MKDFEESCLMKILNFGYEALKHFYKQNNLFSCILLEVQSIIVEKMTKIRVNLIISGLIFVADKMKN